MTFRFWLIAILTLVAVLLVSNRLVLPNLQTQQAPQNLSSNQPSITIGQTTISIEVADTPAEIQQGLSGRPMLPTNTGVLFVLSQRRIPTFWMKDMRFALDFIWIDGDRVVDISQNVPPPVPGTLDNQLLTYSPTTPVTHVLEVNAGFVRNNGIAIGEQVKLNN